MTFGQKYEEAEGSLSILQLECRAFLKHWRKSKEASTTRAEQDQVGQ